MPPIQGRNLVHSQVPAARLELGRNRSGVGAQFARGSVARAVNAVLHLASAQLIANDHRALNHRPHLRERDITRQVF
jgi:hypothetical protein